MNSYEFTIKLSGGIKIFNEMGRNSAEAFNKLKDKFKNLKVSQAKFKRIDFINLN